MEPMLSPASHHLQPGRSHFPIVILTGLSGAGKSTALNVFEDLGFFCVDGLPSSMVSRLVSLFWAQNPSQYRGMALGMDIRQPDLVQEWQRTLDWLSTRNMRPQVIFLEADQETLLRRYATTRRPHPLESVHHGLETALDKEREMLSTLRQDAELIIDTTLFSIHDLRRHLQEKWEFLADTLQGLRVHLISFGYKYGVPKEADLVFDLRFLPNPYFEEQLHHKSGKDSQVASYILEGEPGSGFLEKLTDFVTYILPLYAREGRYRLTITFGCTGGRHRSVAVAEAVFMTLQELSYQVSMEHRHLELG
ncbi:MAG: RNase adapter RapZ [Desulfovermiculus sp.]